MKKATAARIPTTTSVKVIDDDNPPWTEGMLGKRILKAGICGKNRLHLDPPVEVRATKRRAT